MISDVLKIAAGVTILASAIGGAIYYVTKKDNENKLASIKRQVGDNLDFIDAYIALMTSDALSVKQLGELEKLREAHQTQFAGIPYNVMVVMLAQSNGIYMTVRDAAKAHQKK